MIVTDDALDREIWLKYRDGVRFKRIAEDLGISRVTVWRRLRRLLDEQKETPATPLQNPGAGGNSQTQSTKDRGDYTTVPEAVGNPHSEEE